jgi:hypothetical protein
MKPTLVGIVVFACSFGGSLLGMWLRTALAGHHLDSESKVRIGYTKAICNDFCLLETLNFIRQIKKLGNLVIHSQL